MKNAVGSIRVSFLFNSLHSLPFETKSLYIYMCFTN